MNFSWTACQVEYPIPSPLCRYLARALLVPFAFDAPPATPDVLNGLLHNAPSALPQAVQIGRFLKLIDAEFLLSAVEKIQEQLGHTIDGRLAMQYAISLTCAEKVRNICYACTYCNQSDVHFADSC